jgi:hypothetical protein
MVVEIAMPAGGLGKHLDAMHEFHARRGMRARNGPHRRHNERDFISWCFSDSATAETFAAEFGGNLISPNPAGADGGGLVSDPRQGV